MNFFVEYSSWFNDGYLSKFRNITEAALRQQKNAIAHITGEVNFLDLFMRKKNVLLTIHDCRYVNRKQGIEKMLVKWLYLKAPVKKAFMVTAVSETTKQDIIRYTGCDPKKIQVIPVNVNPLFQPVSKSFNKQCPVILQIGTGENKNINRMIDAIKGINCTLVIIGEVKPETIKKLEANTIKYHIKSSLSTEELYLQYQLCDIVCFVSTFEGFGMPIIEANCVERVVITSNISSMPETAGDAACLVDPYNVDSIKQGFLKIINDDDYRHQLIINGRKNKLRFDGEKIADAYYQLYKKMFQNIAH